MLSSAPRASTQQEYQLLNILILEGNHNQHLTEVLDVGGQRAHVILQELHPISKHQVVLCEPPI
jgi:hypothetical protein